tara:strand:- start:8201 stop:9352 length:1152 start_codon:yes stop_codon:yes gene_type:complete
MKKGQSGGNIAVLVLLIAIFISVYILLIPQEDRDDLLNEINKKNDSNGDNGDVELVLLEESVGILKPSDTDTVIHDIDSVSLFFRDEPVTQDLANVLTIENGLFGESSQKLVFNLDDEDNLRDIALFFFVREGDGDLEVKLNGQNVYAGKAEGLQNINLPKNIVGSINELQISVDKGILGNKYVLSDIKLRENFEITNAQEVRNVVLSSAEDENAKLSFLSFCNEQNSGARLRIFVNAKESFNELMPCVPQRKNLEIDKNDLNVGNNEFIFDIDKGDYLLNDLELEVKSKEGGKERIKFPISEEQFNKIQEDNEVVLKVEFGNLDEDDRKGTISVNGKEFSFNTDDDEFEKLITSFVEEGNNFIEIKPDNEFEILNLEIIIER